MAYNFHFVINSVPLSWTITRARSALQVIAGILSDYRRPGTDNARIHPSLGLLGTAYTEAHELRSCYAPAHTERNSRCFRVSL
jgi:hypothetical protein